MIRIRIRIRRSISHIYIKKGKGSQENTEKSREQSKYADPSRRCEEIVVSHGDIGKKNRLHIRYRRRHHRRRRHSHILVSHSHASPVSCVFVSAAASSE